MLSAAAEGGIAMGSNAATYEAYDVVELTLERGVPVKGIALLYEDAIKMWKIWEIAQDETDRNQPAAARRILEEFPKLAQLEGPRISVFEMFGEVIPHFLSLGGSARAFSPEADPVPPSTSDLTT